MTSIDSNNDNGDNDDKKNDQELVLCYGSEMKYQATLISAKRHHK